MTVIVALGVVPVSPNFRQWGEATLWTKLKTFCKSESRRMIWQGTRVCITWSTTWWKTWITCKKTWPKMYKSVQNRKGRRSMTMNKSKMIKKVSSRLNIARLMLKMKIFSKRALMISCQQKRKNRWNRNNRFLQKRNHCCKQLKADLPKIRETQEISSTRVARRSLTASGSVLSQSLLFTRIDRLINRWPKIVTLKMIRI